MTNIYGFRNSIDFKSFPVLYCARSKKTDAGRGEKMLKKRYGFICFTIALTVFFSVGCGRKEESAASLETVQTSQSETSFKEQEQGRKESEANEQFAAKEQIASEESDESSPGTEEEVLLADEAYEGLGQQAEAFAEKIQEAVSDRNLDALGELITYPCVFITVDKETIMLTKEEDLIKQNPDMVFGDDLMVAVANVDTGTLKKTEEGVPLGEGASRIVFKEFSENSFGITEIKE